MGSVKKGFEGTLFLVTGNSSSGKDSIISGLLDKYPPKNKKLVSIKRYITRPPSGTEKNYYITTQGFEDREKKGLFSLSWRIYGLCYGVPIEIDKYLDNGDSVIVNVSRTIVNEAKNTYENIKVIFIKVPLEIIISRLKDRGRETDHLIQQRVERAKTHQEFKDADLIVDNSGDLDNAINQVLDYVIKIINSD